MSLSKLLTTANKKQHIIQLKQKVLQIGNPYRATKYFFDNDIVVEIGSGTNFSRDLTNRGEMIRTDYESLWIRKGDKLLDFFKELPEASKIKKYLK